MEAIASKCHQDPDRIIFEIVKQWMEGKGRPITWDVLIHVDMRTLCRHNLKHNRQLLA